MLTELNTAQLQIPLQFCFKLALFVPSIPDGWKSNNLELSEIISLVQFVNIIRSLFFFFRLRADMVFTFHIVCMIAVENTFDYACYVFITLS